MTYQLGCGDLRSVFEGDPDVQIVAEAASRIFIWPDADAMAAAGFPKAHEKPPHPSSCVRFPRLPVQDDWKIRVGYLKQQLSLTMPATLGVVAEVGSAGSGLQAESRLA